jgi:hypothetical protein
MTRQKLNLLSYLLAAGPVCGDGAAGRCAGDRVEGGGDRAKSGRPGRRAGEVFVEMAEKKQLPDFWSFRRGGIGAWMSQRKDSGEKVSKTSTLKDKKLAPVI